MSAWSAHGVSLVGSARVRLCREDIWMSITATTDSGDVNCLATLSDSLFVAGSMDGSLRFFDSDEGRTCFCIISRDRREVSPSYRHCSKKRSVLMYSGIPVMIPSYNHDSYWLQQW